MEEFCRTHHVPKLISATNGTSEPLADAWVNSQGVVMKGKTAQEFACDTRIGCAVNGNGHSNMEVE